MIGSHPECTLCSLHTVAKSVGIATHHLESSLKLSPSSPTVLVLGQNPGYNEDKANAPFVGKSGVLLRNTYIKGIHLEGDASVWLGNVCRCYHLDGPGPKAIHYKSCAPYLLDDIAYLHARSASLAVLCVGAPAVNWLAKICGHRSRSLRDSFSSQGKEYVIHHPDDQEVRFHVFATFHPAAVLRDYNLIHAVSDHLHLLVLLLRGGLPAPTSPKTVKPRGPRRRDTDAGGT